MSPGRRLLSRRGIIQQDLTESAPLARSAHVQPSGWSGTSPPVGISGAKAKAGYTRRSLADSVSDGGSTPPTSTIISGSLAPSKTAMISDPRKSPVFWAFSLSRLAVIGTLPLALSAARISFAHDLLPQLPRKVGMRSCRRHRVARVRGTSRVAVARGREMPRGVSVNLDRQRATADFPMDWIKHGRCIIE